MFERIRYCSAKNFILGSMCKRESPRFCMTEPQAQLMADVMGDAGWVNGAVALMKTGKSKHEVLALFFIFGRNQTKQIKKQTGKDYSVPPKLWEMAARYALKDAGYDYAGQSAKILEFKQECKLSEKPSRRDFR